MYWGALWPEARMMGVPVPVSGPLELLLSVAAGPSGILVWRSVLGAGPSSVRGGASGTTPGASALRASQTPLSNRVLVPVLVLVVPSGGNGGRLHAATVADAMTAIPSSRACVLHANKRTRRLVKCAMRTASAESMPGP